MSAQSTARRGTAFRALVVDDEAAIRLLCRVNLEASGMQVIEASDGAAGLDAAEEHEPDVVLLDVMMPALNGWDVARELSERGSSTPIIFLTALADPSARVKAYEHGGVGYILKPFDPVALAEYVETAMARIERGEREDLRRGILESGKA